VLLLADPNKLTGDAKTNFDLLAPLGIPVKVLGETRGMAAQQIAEAAAQADLVIDALLGTGLAGEVREPYLSAIRAINECGKPVLAIDIPSGLDADTGRPLGSAVRARATVTFVAMKVGFLAPEAAPYLGRVTVADIGVPLGNAKQQGGAR
jgi:NAD(P)H-hydrate epimerase